MPEWMADATPEVVMAALFLYALRAILRDREQAHEGAWTLLAESIDKLADKL